MCVGVGAKYTTITRSRLQHGTTTGALMKDLSVIGGNVEQFNVSALWACQVRFCNQFQNLITF
jgi:hypothetical protein